MRTAKEFLEIVEKLDGKSAKDSNYSLRDWFKGGGWVQTGGKYDGKPCAKQPGQTTKPYCRDPDDRAALDKKERNKRAAKKRREDPDPDRSGAAKIVTQNEEKDACYKKVKSRYRVWPSAYASGALVKCRKVGASNWGNKTEEVSVADRIKVIQDAGKRAADPNLDRKQVEKMRKKTIKVVKNMKEEHDLFDVVYDFLISENLTEQEVLDIMAHVSIDEILNLMEEA